jgi:hypothetical protein
MLELAFINKDKDIKGVSTPLLGGSWVDCLPIAECQNKTVINSLKISLSRVTPAVFRKLNSAKL